jgi:hypothetical protein
MADQLFRIVAQLDAFTSRPTTDAWRELKRHVIRVSDGLDLVHTNVREERERGTPFTADTARKIEGYARFGVGEG